MTFAELVARLDSPEAGVRRVAVHDLIALDEPVAAAAMLDRLPREADEKAALLMIRHLARIGYRPAMQPLLALYRDRATPVRIAHAAILAHDTLAAG